MAFIQKHPVDIKKELFARIEAHARRAHLASEDPQKEIDYVELSCLYAFGALVKALKIRESL